MSAGTAAASPAERLVRQRQTVQIQANADSGYVFTVGPASVRFLFRVGNPLMSS